MDTHSIYCFSNVAQDAKRVYFDHTINTVFTCFPLTRLLDKKLSNGNRKWSFYKVPKIMGIFYVTCSKFPFKNRLFIEEIKIFVKIANPVLHIDWRKIYNLQDIYKKLTSLITIIFILKNCVRICIRECSQIFFVQHSFQDICAKGDLKLALAITSKAIFKVTVIHVGGQFSGPWFSVSCM